MSWELILIQKSDLQPRHGHQSFQRGQQIRGLQEHQEVQEVQQHQSHHDLPTGENSTEFENTQIQGKFCLLVYRSRIQKDQQQQNSKTKVYLGARSSVTARGTIVTSRSLPKSSE